mmetsp:Transcript_36327/g.81548  ORF Transcript_36327/g.81548 Transcript_36327/m.81548 type:complete len:308 (-) Transcript_36327:368-1291(-)
MATNASIASGRAWHTIHPASPRMLRALGSADSGSSWFPGPAPISSRLRALSGSGDAHCAPAPVRVAIPSNFSARSSVALLQLIVIVDPTRVYLSPRKSRAVASTSGGSRYLSSQALVNSAALLSDCTTTLQSSTNAPTINSSPPSSVRWNSRRSVIDWVKPKSRRNPLNSSAHIAPAFCSPGTFPTICSIMGCPPWTASKHRPCRTPRSCHPGGMGTKIARPPSESIGGCFPWKYAPPTPLCTARAPGSPSSSCVRRRDVSPERSAANMLAILPFDTRSAAVMRTFFLVTSPSELRFSLQGTTRCSV